MIYLYLNETEKLATIVSELIKLNMGVETRTYHLPEKYMGEVE